MIGLHGNEPSMSCAAICNLHKHMTIDCSCFVLVAAYLVGSPVVDREQPNLWDQAVPDARVVLVAEVV